MTDLLQEGGRSVPQRRPFSIRERVAGAFAAQQRANTALALAAFSCAASVALGGGVIRYERLAATQTAALLRSERANADLQDELGRMRDRLAAASQALNQAQTRLNALSDEAQQQLAASQQAATSKADRIAQLGRALEQAQQELHLTEAQRVTLIARLSKAEADLAQGQTKRQQLDEWQRKVEQLTTDRDRAAAERDQLRARVTELQQRLSLRQTNQPHPVAQAAPPAAAAPAAATPQPRQVAVVVPGRAEPVVAAPPAPTVAVADGRLAQFERVLASAGVDVAHLFAEYGMRTGEGGPFIPVSAHRAQPQGELSAEKVAALGRLLRALPVGAPLQSYQVGSPFGIRGDPENGRAAFHTGIDLLAPYESPVYATGPGVVTYAGYRDDYGKVVEIDHGNGISTRYAHLHRYIVSVGQHVAAGTQIGFLGSTGRATGPHVHYEVLVNGEPQDPAKFLGLARLVAVAQR